MKKVICLFLLGCSCVTVHGMNDKEHKIVNVLNNQHNNFTEFDIESQSLINNELNESQVINYQGIHIEQLVKKVDEELSKNNSKDEEMYLLRLKLTRAEVAIILLLLNGFIWSLRCACA